MARKGAGFLIGKISQEGEIRFLGLLVPIEKRINKKGFYDLPKGGIKRGESTLDCAKRECEEESGIIISNSDIIGPSISSDGLTIFPAITNQNPCIKKNPETGVLEHESAVWLTRSEIEKLCLDYLKPAIESCMFSFRDIIDKSDLL